MLERLRGRPVLAGALQVAALAALLLTGCAGQATTSAPVAGQATPSAPVTGQATTSAPVAADQTIFYTYDGPQDGGIIAFNGRDGSTRWHASTGFRSGAAVAAGDVIYTCAYPGVGSLGEDVMALRMSDGKQLWRTSLVPQSQESGNCAFATDGTTLALVGGQRTPIPASDSTLYALSAADGTIRWHQMVNAIGPVFLQHGTMYSIVDTDPYHTTGHVVAAFAASDGKPLWNVPFTGRTIVGDDRALYSDATPPSIIALDLGDGHRLWDQALPDSVITVTDQMLMVTGGTEISALATTDGHALWQSPAHMPSSLTVLAVAQPNMYSILDREVYAFRLSDGTQAWHTHLAQTYVSVVDDVIAQGGVVFVLLVPACTSGCAGAPHIVALDGATGAVYWQQDASGAEFLLAPATSGT